MCCFSVCVYLCCVYVCMLCLMLCVCCILRVCVVVPGETGVVTAGMRNSAVARTRPGTQLRGGISHRTLACTTGDENHYSVDEE